MAGRRANSAYMLVGQIFGKAGLFVSLMIYSRILPDGAFGELLLSVSIGLVTVFLSDMGVTMLVTRRMSTGEPVNRVVTTALFIRAVLSVSALAVVMSAVTIAGYSQRQILLVLLVSSGFILDGFCESTFALFRAREQMFYEGGVRIVHGIIGVSLAVYAWYAGRGVVFAGSTYVFREIPALFLTFTAAFIKMKYRPVFNKGILKQAKPLFIAALPLGLAGILIAAGQRLDGVFIKAFMGDAAIAAYQQCLKLFETLVLIVTPTLIPGALFPALCIAVRNSWGEARTRIIWMTELFLVLAFLLVIPLWAVEYEVLKAVWGGGFLRGVAAEDVRTTFRLVLLTLPAAYIFHLFMGVFIATERQRKILPAVLFPLAAEIVLFLLLIPRFGISGAAVAHAVFLVGAASWMAWNLRGEYGSTGFLRGARRPVLSFLPSLTLLATGVLKGITGGIAALALFLLFWLASGGFSVIPSLRKKQ